MISKAFRLSLLVSGVALTGCAASPTEQTFGDAVRANVAQQKLAPGEETLAADGQRVESTMELYRTLVGDQAPVVRTREVEQE